MVPATVRLYNEDGADRVAVVSSEPASAGFLIRLARGPRAGKLAKGAVYGPYPADELAERFAELVASLRDEGFTPGGLAAMLGDLDDPHPATRGRAAARLGWRRSVEAVVPLIDRLPQAVDEACPFLDALGAIGDPRAIPIVREYAARKLLSRRRSAVEALRHLGDAEGLAAAVDRARESLPAPARDVLDATDPADASAGPAALLAQAVKKLDPKLHGLTLDTLCEIGTPAAMIAVRTLLADLDLARPNIWRYAKSVYKRSQLRHDLAMFGLLGHAIEIRARDGSGTKATVKSGYDGVERPTSIFGRKTQDHARRLGWRYLRNLAAYRPELYAHAAAEVVVAYGPEDAEEPDGLRGEFARCYLLHRVLYGASHRFRLDDRRLTFRFVDASSTHAPDSTDEESCHDLWDAQPAAFLRVLAASRLPEAHAFAARAVAGPHRRVLSEAENEIVLRLLRAPHEPTVLLGLDELDRRFDPARPDLVLVDLLLSDDLPRARELGRRWLRAAAPRWTLDQEWTLIFLGSPDAQTASLAADLASPALRDRADLREALAGRLLALLKAPEAGPGTHDVYARVALDALADELATMLTLDDLLAMVAGGSPPAQALAGGLLARRPDAIEVLGIDGLVALAEHEVALVRRAAHALMRSGTATTRLQADPSPLYRLVESEWPDTRGVAFTLIRHAIGLGTVEPDALMGLLDSNRGDVQEIGRELARKHMAALDPRALMSRLVEHPHPGMRRFALDLVVEHLPDGPLPLDRLEPFFRSGLLDLRPDRLLKRRLIDFLLRRGLRDEHQARVAARLLGEMARVDVRADFEHALEAVVRLNLSYPGLASPVTVELGGVA